MNAGDRGGGGNSALNTEPQEKPLEYATLQILPRFGQTRSKDEGCCCGACLGTKQIKCLADTYVTETAIVLFPSPPSIPLFPPSFHLRQFAHCLPLHPIPCPFDLLTLLCLCPLLSFFLQLCPSLLIMVPCSFHISFLFLRLPPSLLFLRKRREGW